MKTQINLFVLSLIFLSHLSSLDVNAQWTVNPVLGNRDGETDPNLSIESIGIGDFQGNSDVPKAALDIVIPYLPALISYPPGEAFRTTASKNVDHVWRMFSGSSQPFTSQFYIMNPTTPPYQNNIILSSVLGHLDFDARDIHWMRLHSTGQLGLSNSFTSGFVAQSLLHLNQTTNSDVFEQFTNNNTGYSTSTDGFRVGISHHPGYPGTANSFAKLIQYENAPMKFYTNAVDRMIINADYNPTIHQVPVNTTGYVGIGLPNFWNEENGGEGSRSLLHLQGDYNAFVNGNLS